MLCYIYTEGDVGMEKLNRLIMVNKFKKVGLIVSALFVVLNLLNFKLTHSVYADIGTMISMIGVIYFFLDSKGY